MGAGPWGLVWLFGSSGQMPPAAKSITPAYLPSSIQFTLLLLHSNTLP